MQSPQKALNPGWDCCINRSKLRLLRRGPGACRGRPMSQQWFRIHSQQQLYNIETWRSMGFFTSKSLKKCWGPFFRGLLVVCFVVGWWLVSRFTSWNPNNKKGPMRSRELCNLDGRMILLQICIPASFRSYSLQLIHLRGWRMCCLFFC